MKTQYRICDRLIFIAILVGMFLSGNCIEASARKITMACRILSSSPSYGQIAAEVDKIIIDTDTPRVELQVANTMETKLPINWLYQKGGIEGNDDLVIMEGSGTIAMAARRYGTAVALVFDEATGKLRWTYAGQPDGNFTYLFTCRR